MPYPRMRFTRRPRRRRGNKIRRFTKRRRKKSTVFRNRRAKTSNVVLGRRPKRLTLSTRIKRLEISSKKHYDYVLSRDTGVPIASYGADNGTQTNESFSQMLAIQPRNGDNTIPPISGSARGTERNTREGMEIFCTKVRLRGRILGIRANNTDEVKNCAHAFMDVSAAVTLYNVPHFRDSALRAAMQTRIHIVVLQDTRPSTIDPVTGLYEPNPLPVQPMNPLQGLYQIEGLTVHNTLSTLGLDASLRNYTNNRFKIVHQSTLTFDWAHNSKWFDITINVNKKLVYKPATGLAAQGNSDPVNYNLLFYVSSVPSETSNADNNPEFVMNDVTTTPPTPVNLLLQPNLQMLSSRTYFRET